MPKPTAHPTIWHRLRFAYFGGLLAFFLSVAFYFGPNVILFRKLTWIAPEDFAAIAQRECVPIVVAIKAYHRDHGQWPASVLDLAPRYLPDPHVPATDVSGRLRYWTKFNHRIVYELEGDEGWSVEGVYTSGPISLPLVPPAPASQPATTRGGNDVGN